MKSRFLKVILSAIALSVAAASGTFGQEPKKIGSGEQLLLDGRNPQLAFARFEGAWKRSDAEAISAMAGKNKVFIQMKGMAESGEFYSRSQVFFLLKNLFRENRQMKFEFVKYHNLDRPDRRVFAIAYRSYKNVRSEKVFQDKVYVTLCKEEQDWVLAEIKTTR